MNGLIGKVTKAENGNYDVSFLPDNETWITIDKKLGIPKILDIVEFIPPKVLRLIRK